MKKAINWGFNRHLRLKVLIRRIWRKRIYPSEKLLVNQEIALSIIRKAIINEDAKLLLAPLSETRYIQYNDIFIRIQPGFVSIINGKYSYDVSMPNSAIESIVDKFNIKLESTRKKWENSMTQKTTKSLNTILSELS